MTVKNKVAAIFGITIATCGLATPGFSEPAEHAEVQVDPASQLVKEKLRSIKVTVSFQDTSITDAIHVLSEKAAVDTDGLDPIRFVVTLPMDRTMPTIRNLKLKNVPLEVALKYICEATEMNYEVIKDSVSITSPRWGDWQKAKK